MHHSQGPIDDVQGMYEVSLWIPVTQYSLTSPVQNEGVEPQSSPQSSLKRGI